MKNKHFKEFRIKFDIPAFAGLTFFKTSLISIFSFLSLFMILTINMKSQYLEEKTITKADSSAPALIDIKPTYIKIKQEGKFVTKELNVLNRGGSLLKIEKIEGSCFCATGNIMNGNVYPMSMGKISLSVNIDGLQGAGSRIIMFSIYSNASNSPYTIKMEILPPDSLKSNN